MSLVNECTFKWDKFLKEAFLQILKEKLKGKTATKVVLNKKIWKEILDSFRALTMRMDAEKKHLHSQLSYLKGKYQTFKSLKDNSGFGWDSEAKLPTASDQVWKAYISAHPKAKEFRYHTLENFEQLSEIFEGRLATGNYILTSVTGITKSSMSTFEQLTQPLNTQDIDEEISESESEIEFTPRKSTSNADNLTPRKKSKTAQIVSVMEKLVEN